MKICTSYFANLKKLPAEIVPISIALFPPKWYNGLSYYLLAPTREILNEWHESDKGGKAQEKYRVDFLCAVLAKRNRKSVLEDLSKLSGGKDVALLCFERPEEFCHRHIVADWLNFLLLVKNPVLEWEDGTPKQEELF